MLREPLKNMLSTASRKNLKRVLGLFALIIFSYLVIFGVGMKMDTSQEESMVGCIFMDGQSSFCQMDVFQHWREWKQNFTAILSSENFIFWILVMLALFVTSVLKIFRETNTLEQQKDFERYSFLENPHFRLFDFLVLFFSRGILKNQIYG